MDSGVSQSTITRLNAGEPPGLNSMVSLCRYLRTDVESFIEPIDTAPSLAVSVNTEGLSPSAVDALHTLAELGNKIAGADREQQ